MRAILVLLAVSPILGFALGSLHFSWVAIAVSGFALAIVLAAVLRNQNKAPPIKIGRPSAAESPAICINLCAVCLLKGRSLSTMVPQAVSFDDTVDALLPRGRDTDGPLGPLGDGAHCRHGHRGLL
jgi:hypothetical protein